MTNPRIEQAIGHMHAGAWDEATQVLQGVLDDVPGDAQALRLMGTIHYANGRLEPAANLLEASVRADPGALSGWLNLGSVHLAVGRPDQAVEAAERALAIDARSTDALFNLGVALQHDGRHEEAEQAYERLLAVDPGSVDARMNLAALAMLRGALPRAAALAEAIVAASPEHLQARLCAARAHAGTGDADLADEHLRAAEDLAGGSPAVLGERIEWLIGLGRFPEAEALLERLLGAELAEPGPLCQLARVLEETGRSDAALERLREARERFPRSPEVAVQLAATLAAARCADEALEAAGAALALAPDSAQAHLCHGERLLELGRLEEADAALARAVGLAPPIVLAHDRRVRVALERGEPEAALEICERYLAAHPTERTLLAAKGMILHELGEHARAAELLGLEPLPMIEQIEAPEGFESVTAFNRALEAHVRAHPSLAESPSSHATRNGHHTGNLFAGERGPFAAFEALLWEASVRFVDRPIDHAYLRDAPDLERIFCWAVLMRREGHQAAHIHPAAWLSGVYYARVPEAVSDESNTEGWLEFGEPPRELYRLEGEQAHRLVRPREGTLVLFPSYLYHRTIPYEADAERLSIAFDFLPRLAPAGQMRSG